MSWIPAPLVQIEPGRTPVTVWLTERQCARLEAIAAGLHVMDPALSVNDVTDTIMAAGLKQLETELAALGQIRAGEPTQQQEPQP
jgi:hypothetical protein